MAIIGNVHYLKKNIPQNSWFKKGSTGVDLLNMESANSGAAPHKNQSASNFGVFN